MLSNGSLIKEKYENIIVIISPPRCSSTALARVFWEHPSVRYYAHEPFETLYYEDDEFDIFIEKIENPIDLCSVKKIGARTTGRNLVIKEMPYQVGEHLEFLTRLATLPVVFLIRDPRVNIASRIKHKIIGGDAPNYPFVESGWHLLHRQILKCRKLGVPFHIIESKNFRNQPETYLRLLFNNLNLNFTPDMLTWESYPDVELDNLGGAHEHLYKKILGSQGLIPETESPPRIDQFSQYSGFRRHIEECMNIYTKIKAFPEVL